MVLDLEGRPWWEYLEKDLRELFNQSLALHTKVESWDQHFHDYSFIVFPAAKAYEGVLKKVFLDLDLITERDFYSTRFRIGKSLNPNYRPKKSKSVYTLLESYCGGEEVPRQLWETWKVARNRLFHWFPKEAKAVNLKEAEDRLKMVLDSVDSLFSVCKTDLL